MSRTGRRIGGLTLFGAAAILFAHGAFTVLPALLATSWAPLVVHVMEVGASIVAAFLGATLLGGRSERLDRSPPRQMQTAEDWAN